VGISSSVFNLSQNVTIPKNLIITNNGLVKNLYLDYTISASKFLVFNSNQTPGDKITIRYINTVGNADIEVFKYTANGVSSSYSVSSSLNNVNGLLVSINGLLQTPLSHYYINSSSLYDSVVLDEPPKSGSLIEIRKIQYASPYSTLTASFATTASYALNADINFTASNLVQNTFYNVSQSQTFTVLDLPLSDNNWNIGVIEEWDSGSYQLDSQYSNVELLLHFSQSLIDNSVNNLTSSISGSPIITTNRYKFKDSSLFLSNNSYLYYPSLLPTSSNFTVETWVYPISFTNQPVIWAQGSGYPLGANRTQVYVNTNGNIIAQNGVNVITSSLIIPVSEWTNIAYVKSSSKQFLFIDGILSSTGSVSDIEDNLFFIGQNYLQTTQYFNGNINEFRVTNFARYSSSYEPLSYAFPNTSSITQSFVRYFATVGGLNDNNVDYGVQKLTDTSLIFKRLQKSTQPLSGTTFIPDNVSRVYLNVIDNSKSLIQVSRASYANIAGLSNFSTTASYSESGSYSLKAKTSDSSSYISASVVNMVGLVRITGSLIISGSTPGVYLHTQSIASTIWNITHSLLAVRQ